MVRILREGETGSRRSPLEDFVSGSGLYFLSFFQVLILDLFLWDIIRQHTSMPP